MSRGRRIQCLCPPWAYCRTGVKDGEDNREVTLKFRRENLLYDIRNYAFIGSHVMSDDLEHIKHSLADIGEEGNVNRVNRLLALVFSYVEQVCEDILADKQKNFVEEVVVDHLEIPNEYRLDLSVPKEMTGTAVRYLSNLIHELLVYRAMYDWLTMVYPQGAQVWLAKCVELEEEIDELINSKNKVDVRPMHPW